MRTAIVIPARLGARRLPNKPLALLGEIPLIVRTVRQAEKCEGADLVVVATDSPEIETVVRQNGSVAILTRPDHASGTDRVAEAAKMLDADRVVNLQGDEPFIDPKDLGAVLQSLQESASPMATLRAPLKDPADLTNPDVVKVVTRDDGQALYFSRAPIPFDQRDTESLANVFCHVGVYGYHRHTLTRLTQTPPHPLEQREGLEQLRALALGVPIAVLDARSVTRGIDTEDDLAWARARVEQLGEAAFP